MFAAVNILMKKSIITNPSILTFDINSCAFEREKESARNGRRIRIKKNEEKKLAGKRSGAVFNFHSL
jgi:hypothetical protein